MNLVFNFVIFFLISLVTDNTSAEALPPLWDNQFVFLGSAIDNSGSVPVVRSAGSIFYDW